MDQSGQRIFHHAVTIFLLAKRPNPQPARGGVIHPQTAAQAANSGFLHSLRTIARGAEAMVAPMLGQSGRRRAQGPG
jgi:hypothetical protein